MSSRCGFKGAYVTTAEFWHLDECLYPISVWSVYLYLEIKKEITNQHVDLYLILFLW